MIKEDIRFMKEAHINCVSLGIFAWSKPEPSDGVYDFKWLHEIIDELYANGINTILATPNTAIPFYIARKYPEILITNELGIGRLPDKKVDL
ncbi:MAG: beta-galactosidase [Erysipelotrichaceae bacterium]|nr:beta-galactosidase [Erysipelotrichaceae bacterium]